MNDETSIPWQSVPTIVELTADGARKQQIARQMAEMLEDGAGIGAAAGAAGTAGPSGGGWSVEALVREFRFGGTEVPSIVSCAAPLLNLAYALRHTNGQPDVAELRRVTMDAVTRYERDLTASRVSAERARAAHYVICATVDDVVLSKPWGVRAGWARSGLVSTFHMDVTGGDRVFDLLDHFHRQAATNKDLLLLIYLCLSLAFEGRTRVSPRGALELARIRDNLYKTLAGQYGVFERELSPHWRGVAAKHAPLRTAAVMWTLVSVLALVFATGYLAFTVSLKAAAEHTFTQLASLPPNETPSVYIPPRPKPKPEPPPVTVERPKPPAVPAPPNRMQQFVTFLQPEVERGLLTLSNDHGQVLVRISDAGLFPVGSATVQPAFESLLQRIGGVLAAENFRALVLGYTDNTPIRTAQFPSNQELSAARAAAVGAILATFTGPEAILTEGRADTQPIASNDTAEGRAANRRTEILVLADPDEKLAPGQVPPVLQNDATSTAPTFPAQGVSQ